MGRGRILIAEDDCHISNLVKYNLERAGFECIVTSSGEGLFKYLDTQPADLIILDIMLPHMDGFEVCRLLKQNEGFAGIPVVMLTAKGEEVDRIVGFELGADDYVVKTIQPPGVGFEGQCLLTGTGGHRHGTLHREAPRPGT